MLLYLLAAAGPRAVLLPLAHVLPSAPAVGQHAAHVLPSIAVFSFLYLKKIKISKIYVRFAKISKIYPGRPMGGDRAQM